MQVLDHCSIFLLIAGSYTPFSLCTLREESIALGWGIFGVIWTAAVVGIILNSIDLKKYKKFSMICYLLMGWCIIFEMPLLIRTLGMAGFALLISGGIIYTIGAVLYGIRKEIQIYAFSISYLYMFRKFITIFMHTIICYVNWNEWSSTLNNF